MQIERLRVRGISYAGWAREVRQALQSINGVSAVQVAVGSGEAEIQFDEKLTSFDDVKMALLQEGFACSTA